MKTTEIYLITLKTEDGLSVLEGGTNYRSMASKFDATVMSSGLEPAQFVTVKVPEIILTGSDAVIDLTEQTNNG